MRENPKAHIAIKANKAYHERHKLKEERENLDDDVAEIEAYNERHSAAFNWGKRNGMARKEIRETG